MLGFITKTKRADIDYQGQTRPERGVRKTLVTRNVHYFRVQIADKELKCIKCHEDGALLAVGDECGKTYVVEMNDWFVVPGKTDKALLMAVSRSRGQLMIYYFAMRY